MAAAEKATNDSSVSGEASNAEEKTKETRRLRAKKRGSDCELKQGTFGKKFSSVQQPPVAFYDIHTLGYIFFIITANHCVIYEVLYELSHIRKLSF